MQKTGIYYKFMHNKNYVLTAEIGEKFDRKKCVNLIPILWWELKASLQIKIIFLWHSNLNESVSESLIYI